MSNASDGADSTDIELADDELEAVAGGAFATNVEPGVEIAGGTAGGPKTTYSMGTNPSFTHVEQ